MTVSYESTVREMDAEELEAEANKPEYIAALRMSAKGFRGGAITEKLYRLNLIRRNYQQLTGKPLTNGHLPTVL